MSKITKDNLYEKVTPPIPMRACACCGSPAELWKYRANPDSLTYVPGCSMVEGFGWLERQPCPMYEIDHLQRDTKKEAARDWNSFNDELEKHRAIAAAPPDGSKV